MRKLNIVCSLLLLMSLVPTCVAQYAEAGQSGPQSTGRWIAIRAGRMFDGKSDHLVSNQTIVIHGERIVEVGPSERVKTPAGAQVIDLSHATVLPGLIDAHTGFADGTGERQAKAIQNVFLPQFYYFARSIFVSGIDDELGNIPG